MQEPQAAASASSSFDFGSLLASLTSPAKKPAEDWDDSSLADDIATITYEQALRTHTRGRVGASGLPSMRVGACEEIAPASLNEKTLKAHPRPIEASCATDAAGKKDCPRRGEDRRAASVIIGMSKAECLQLRERAVEAGLTVSAYLRSCIFEVETLRTQVREGFVQLRSPCLAETVAPQEPDDTHIFSWRARLFPRWSRRICASKA
jgi:hypothetical protein